MRVLNLPLFTFLFLYFVITGTAQINNQPNGHNSCISDKMRADLIAKDPTYLKKEKDFNDKIRQMTIAKSNQSNLRTTLVDVNNPCTIPVVFHIIVPPGQTLATFIPDIENKVNKSIEWLNNAFAGQSPYGGVNSNIKFVLAQQDINHQYTSGITQITDRMSNLNAVLSGTALANYDDALINSVKAQNGGSFFLFPNDQYVNIFIVNSITENDGSTPAGYAYLPVSNISFPTPDLVSDVIIVNKDYLGTSTKNGVVMIHEMGHFLGLLHTFTGAGTTDACKNNDCLFDGDQVCDTPPDATNSANSNCNTNDPINNSCHSDGDDQHTYNPFRSNGGLGDQKDLINNYMDYGDATCKNAFTQGQIDRMVNTLNSVRASLCGSIGTLSLCPKPVFSFNTTIDNATVSNQARIFPDLKLINSGTSKSGFNYEVDFGDGSLVTLYDATLYSTTVPITHSYASDQTYTIKITLKYRTTPSTAFLPECTMRIFKSFTSRCPFVPPTFTVSKTIVDPNESITFTNTTTCQTSGACSYSWLKDGQNFSTDPATATNQISSTTGVNQVQLQMTYSGCTVKSAGLAIQVGGNLCMIDKRYSKFIWTGSKKAWDFTETGLVSQDLNSNMAQEEACSIICDKYTGEILLYTDGQHVYGHDNQIIPGGTNVFPQADSRTSANKGNIILQNPIHKNLYYIFSTPGIEVFSNGSNADLYYVIVDINQGTNGTIISSHIPLLANAPEKMVATSKIDGSGYFLITHETGGNRFVTFEITGSGVNAIPHYSSGVSNVNVPYSNGSNIIFDGVSGMTINQQGTQLAILYGDQFKVEIYQYNAVTGKVIENNLISTINTPFIGYGGAYQVQFSPNGKKLYLTQDNGSFIQYDLENSDIQNSAIIFPEVADGISIFGQMLTTPDGRLLVASLYDKKLYEIKIPNATAANNACDIEAIETSDLFYAKFGLSAAPVDLTRANKFPISGTDCVKPGIKGSVYSLNVPMNPVNTYQWIINQGIPPLASINGSSTGTTVTLDFSSQSGTVELQCQVTTPCGTDIIKKTITINSTCSGPACTIAITTANNEPTVLIPTCHPSVTLNASNGFASYQWRKGPTIVSGATNSTLTLSTGLNQAGDYTVAGIDVNGCSATSNAITVIDGLTITGNDNICPGQKASLQVNIAGVTGNYYVQWVQNGGVATTQPSGTQGDYYAMVVLPEFAGCTLTTVPKAVQLLTAPSPYTVSADRQFICGNVATLTAKAPAYTAVPITSNTWSNGGDDFADMPATSVFSNVTVGGSYYVTSLALSNGCTAVSNVVLVIPPDITIRQRCTSGGVGTELIADQNIPDGNYVWKNSGGTVVATTQSYIPTIVGTYSVTSSSTNCFATASTVVCTQPPSNLGTNLVTRGDFNISSTASPICTNYAVNSDLTCSDATTIPLNSATWPSNFKITSNAAQENLNKWSGTGFVDPNKPADTYCLIADGRVTTNDDRVWYQQVAVESCATYTFRALIDNIIINEAEIPRVSLKIKNGSVTSFIKGTTVFASQSNWVELSGTWKSPLTGTVEISVVLDGGGFVGRDIALDEIYFAKTNCSSLDDFRPGRHCKAVADVGMNKYVCSGQSVQIGNNQTTPGLTYSWTTLGYATTTANPTVNPTVTNTYKLVVTDNANNCSATDYVTVSVIVPEVTISKDLTTGCTASQVKASLFSGIPNVQYEWQVNGVVKATNTTGIYSLTGIATGAVVRCRLVTACSSTIYSNSITVGTSVPVTATAATICSGGSTQLHANMSGGTAPYTYTWTASTGAVPAAVAEPVVSPIATTTYTLNYHDANNCTFTGSVLVTVNALPQLVTATPATGCVGTSKDFTVVFGSGNTLNTATNPTMLSVVGGFPTNGGYGFTANITAAGSSNFVFETTNGQGCSRTTVVPFTANAGPIPMTITASPNPVCLGTPINVSVSYGSSNTLTSFTDPAGLISRIGGGGGPGGMGFSANTVGAGTGNFVGVSTNAQGCSTTVSVPLTVVALPPAMTIVPTSNPVCVGSTFTVNVNYGSGSGYSFTSQTDPSIISRISGGAYPGGYVFGATATTVGTGNFVGVLTSLVGGCSTTVSVPFTANALPPALNVTISQNPACEGSFISVGVSYGPGYSGTLTRPSMIGTSTGGGGGQYGYGYTAPVIAAGTENFVSTSTSAQGCSTVVNIPFTALPRPVVPAITSTGTLICSGSPILLSTTSTGNAYQWYNGANLISGATNASYNSTTAGSYSMRVIDANTCSNTSTGINLTTSTLAAPRVHVDDATDVYCASTPIAMKVGTAVQLNGTNQYVNVPSMNYPSSGTTYGGPITVEFWINSTGNYGSAFSLGGLNNSNRAQAHVPGGDGNLYWDYGNYQTTGRISTPFSAYINKWTHVALVSAGNGGNYKAIYLNGVKVASSTSASDGPDVALSGLIIGKWLTLYTGGMMDEFRIWNKVLSDAEVKSAMTSLYDTGTPNLMGSWGFDEASGTTVNNDAFSAQTGTLMNSATRAYPSTLTYTWSPSANLNTSSGTSVIPNTSIVRTYTVKGVDANGCSAYAQVVATPVSTCKESEARSDSPIGSDWDVEIYPNPTEGEVHISFKNITDDSKLSIEVIGMGGEVVLQIDQVEVNQMCNLHDLPSGMYLIRVKNGEKIKVKKVVVVK